MTRRRLRQLYILDLGPDQPTVLLSNDTRTPKTLITRYAQRLLIENAICLAAASRIHLPNLHSFLMGCHAGDDFLDSVVAAVGAACRARSRDRFQYPQSDEPALARLDGRISVVDPFTT